MTTPLRTLALVGACAVGGCQADRVARSPAAAVAASDPFVAATRRIEASVVLLTMKIPGENPKRSALDDAYGSGVVVASGAWGSQILTAEHVIRGARALRAALGGTHSVRAHVEAWDARLDLALVGIATPELPAAHLAFAQTLEPGRLVGVAGFPIPDAFEDERLGTKPSVFAGRVSSLRRDAIELDLPVIPGESGGPVFDGRSGEVVAIADSRFDEEKAIGFGIPLADVRTFLRGRLRR